MDTLTRMRAFVAVVDNEGFSAAARAMGRSKALLSKYVRELEDETGALLLNRTTRQFSLTEAGHTYYGRAVELIREMDDLHDMMRDTRAGISGTIRMSAPRTFADADIGQSLMDFMRDNPEVVLDVDLDDRFVDLVEEGYDVAIRMASMDDSSLIAKRVSSFRIGAYAAPAVIKKLGAPEHPSALAELPCIVDTNTRRRDVWQFSGSDGSAIPTKVNGMMYVNSPLATRRALLSGLGFGMCPEFIVREDLKSGALVQILEPYLHLESGIFAVFPHRRYLPGKVRAFVDYLAEWFKTHDV